RMTPAHLTPAIDAASWARPPLFAWLQEAGGVAEAEMRRTFNCGVGLLLAVAADAADGVLAELAAGGETAWICGALTPRAP
ncbi:MAG: AIR synthase-related protein, partial [Caulobacterales bacterium]|nr:AIR synthase-related protein [Caulobacterales bacterium]